MMVRFYQPGPSVFPSRFDLVAFLVSNYQEKTHLWIYQKQSLSFVIPSFSESVRASKAKDKLKKASTSLYVRRSIWQQLLGEAGVGVIEEKGSKIAATATGWSLPVQKGKLL